MAARELPRSFKFYWGGGEISEEASYTGLRQALRETPKLRELLRRLAD